jgi:cytochrome c biogenesis factor
LRSRWFWLHAALVLATAVVAVILLVTASDPKSDGLAIFGLFVLCFVPSLGAVIALLLEVFTAAKGTRRRTMIRRLGSLLPHAGILLAAMAMYVLDWPFRARFEMSRGALETVAHRALTRRQGQGEATRIGLFRVESVDLDGNGDVQFHLGDCSWYYACDFVFHRKADCVRAATRDGSVIDSRWCLERYEGF